MKSIHGYVIKERGLGGKLIMRVDNFEDKMFLFFTVQDEARNWILNTLPNEQHKESGDLETVPAVLIIEDF